MFTVNLRSDSLQNIRNSVISTNDKGRELRINLRAAIEHICGAFRATRVQNPRHNAAVIRKRTMEGASIYTTACTQAKVSVDHLCSHLIDAGRSLYNSPSLLLGRHEGGFRNAASHLGAKNKRLARSRTIGPEAAEPLSLASWTAFSCIFVALQ